MSNVVHVSINKTGENPMHTQAPQPSATNQVSPQAEPIVDHFAKVKVTIAGCGGCGINLTRPFKEITDLHVVKYFDTSMHNSRPGEKVDLVIDGPGSGSGSNRAEHAKSIESYVAKLDAEHLGEGDVAIVVFSLAGGSGSVIGPLLVREYTRRKMRVIVVAVADTSSSVGAKNTLNTLKTLTAVTANNGIYLPTILLSNDMSKTRGAVDKSAELLMGKVVKILTSRVHEVDRNDRLNWVDPSKVAQVDAGLKIMSFAQKESDVDTSIVLGTDSTEMVDSLLILSKSPDEDIGVELPPARLKKSGFFEDTNRHNLVGKVSSDITSINKIIDHVEKMQQVTNSHKLTAVDRLSNLGGSDDLIL